jgi:hypothetical protein
VEVTVDDAVVSALVDVLAAVSTAADVVDPIGSAAEAMAGAPNVASVATAATSSLRQRRPALPAGGVPGWRRDALRQAPGGKSRQGDESDGEGPHAGKEDVQIQR